MSNISKVRKVIEIADWVKTRPDFGKLEFINSAPKSIFGIACYDPLGKQLNFWDLWEYQGQSSDIPFFQNFVQSANMMTHVIVDAAKKPMYASKEYQDEVNDPILGIHIASSNKPIEDNEEDYLLDYPDY
jgi:hypothetical protein